MLHVRTHRDLPNYEACLWLDIKECIASLMTSVNCIPDQPPQMQFGKHEHHRRAFAFRSGEIRLPRELRDQIADEAKERKAIAAAGDYTANSDFAPHVAELILAGGTVERRGASGIDLPGNHDDLTNAHFEIILLLKDDPARLPELRVIAELLKLAGIKGEQRVLDSSEAAL